MKMSHYFYITPNEYAEAEKNGVDPFNLERRIHLLGWDKKKAIQTPLGKITNRKYWAKIAKQNGIKYQTFMNRVNNHGWDEGKAATTPVISKQKQVENMNRKKKRVIPKEILSLAESNGIAYYTLRKRIKKGMDPVEAATQPLMTYSESGRLGAMAYENEHGRFHRLIFN
jgi:hypothetical protein